MLYEYTYSLHQEIMMDIPRLGPITARIWQKMVMMDF